MIPNSIKHLVDNSRKVSMFPFVKQKSQKVSPVVAFFGQRQPKSVAIPTFFLPHPQLKVFMQVGKPQEAAARNHIRFNEIEVLF